MVGHFCAPFCPGFCQANQCIFHKDQNLWIIYKSWKPKLRSAGYSMPRGQNPGNYVVVGYQLYFHTEVHINIYVSGRRIFSEKKKLTDMISRSVGCRWRMCFKAKWRKQRNATTDAKRDKTNIVGYTWILMIEVKNVSFKPIVRF